MGKVRGMGRGSGGCDTRAGMSCAMLVNEAPRCMVPMPLADGLVRPLGSWPPAMLPPPRGDMHPLRPACAVGDVRAHVRTSGMWPWWSYQHCKSKHRDSSRILDKPTYV